MSKKENKMTQNPKPVVKEERPRLPFYGDHYDRFEEQRNTACRGCPYNGQCSTCFED